ncbi:MAG TPA: SCO family protein [Flavisolibacter sp.]|jgi:protein SCO1/2
MSKKAIFYIVFFTVLVIGFFLVVSKAIPGYTTRKQPPIGKVAPFAFITQDGKAFTEKDVAGKVVAVEYFFTTCRGICPRMNTNMRKVYDALKDEKDFFILSHTSDPERDTPPQLKRYADSMGVNTAKWVFVTGTKDSLYQMARRSYKIDDPNNHPQNPEDDFLHSQFIALVNREGEVVRIFDGLKQSEMFDLVDDAKKLLKD